MLHDFKDAAADRTKWRATLAKQMKGGEENIWEAWTDKRRHRKGGKDHTQAVVYTCNDY